MFFHCLIKNIQLIKLEEILFGSKILALVNNINLYLNKNIILTENIEI